MENQVAKMENQNNVVPTEHGPFVKLIKSKTFTLENVKSLVDEGHNPNEIQGYGITTTLLQNIDYIDDEVIKVLVYMRDTWKMSMNSQMNLDDRTYTSLYILCKDSFPSYLEKIKDIGCTDKKHIKGFDYVSILNF